MITKITDAYFRNYKDNGQMKAYVEWIDDENKTGRTEGEPENQHMQALMQRAQREGIAIRQEWW